MNDSTPWRPSRSAAMTIAALSAWPILYFCIFFGFILFMMVAGGSEQQSGWPLLFKSVIVLHLLTILLMFVLLAIYIVHLVRTDLIAKDQKVIWLLVLFFGNVFAYPVYWYLFIWKPLRGDA